MTRALPAVAAVWSLLAFASCATDARAPAPRAPQPMMVAAAAPGAVLRAEAVDVLAQARCVREQRCDGVGPGRLYPSPAECVSVMRWDAQQNLASCQHDVKQRELYGCARAVENQPCGMLANPLEWFARLTSCRSDNVCLR